jgi:hypothetical protein
MKKKSFFLLEFLLIIMLLSTGGLFLIKNTYLFFNTQIKTLESMEFERLSDLTFGECKALFYQKKIPIKNLTPEKPLTLRLYPISLEFPALSFSKTIERSILITPLKKSNPQGKMIRITLFLQTHTNEARKYTYDLVIKHTVDQISPENPFSKKEDA